MHLRLRKLLVNLATEKTICTYEISHSKGNRQAPKP